MGGIEGEKSHKKHTKALEMEQGPCRVPNPTEKPLSGNKNKNIPSHLIKFDK